MTTLFKVHTPQTAPDASKPLFENSIKLFGMIPNMHAVMAESPQMLEAYQTLTRLSFECSLAPIERHVVWLTINVEHACLYCVPAHTTLAYVDETPKHVVDSVRDGRPLDDAKLEALSRFTLGVLRARGQVPIAEVEAFFAAGYAPRHVMEVLVLLSQKVLSSYLNHMAKIPLDDTFAPHAWAPPVAHAAE